MNKNKEKLDSFVKYCEDNPNHRFWQALRNWSRETIDHKINFIFIADIGENFDEHYSNLKDTFYIE